MGRAPCCDKSNVKKGPWSPEEDAKLKSYIDNHGTGGNWIALPQKIGLKRCGKSCRLRWLNYLRPNIKHGGFSEEEDNIICSLYISIGSRWSIIAAQLPGRTDNDIKNYWNTKLKKKLLGKQRREQKQEGKRSTEIAKVAPTVDVFCGSRISYWPEQPAPVYPVSQADHHADHEQASIKKLLIKLGGRFSSDKVISPIAVEPPISVPERHHFDDQYPVMEFGELLDCGPIKLDGLDCFYGMGDVNEGSGTSTSTSENWSEMGAMMYPPPSMVVPVYQGMQQLMFEDPLQLGML